MGAVSTNFDVGQATCNPFDFRRLVSCELRPWVHEQMRPRSMRSADSLNHSWFHTASMRAIGVNPSVLPEPTPLRAHAPHGLGLSTVAVILKAFVDSASEKTQPRFADFMLFDQIVDHDVNASR